MGLMDKLKNALFEEVEEEVEDKPVKPKKEKVVNKKEESVKDKIKKKKEKEKLEKENKSLVDDRVDHHVLKDEDFEIKPKLERRDDEDLVLEKPISVEGSSFKVIEDKDLIVDESFDDTAQIVDIIEEKDEDYSYYKDEKPVKMEDKDVDEAYNRATEVNHSNLYGMSDNSDIKVHEYGAKSKKDDRNVFKPSPIISPVYGVLDKNYRKEDVVDKTDKPFTSSYERRNMSVDEVRKKAYGTLSDDLIDDMDKELENTMPIPKIDEDYNEDTVVDLSDEETKPEVKTVTMGDAEEYFQDLGLEYNVDYVDANNTKEEVKEDKGKHEGEEVKPEEEKKVEVKEEVEEKPEEEKIKEEIKVEEDEDDNLFDLIDSMYQESE